MPHSIYDSNLQSTASGKNGFAHGGWTLTVQPLLLFGKSLRESKQHVIRVRGTIILKFWTMSVEKTREMTKSS